MTLRTDEGRGEVVYQAPFEPSVQMQRIKVAEGHWRWGAMLLLDRFSGWHEAWLFEDDFEMGADGSRWGTGYHGTPYVDDHGWWFRCPLQTSAWCVGPSYLKTNEFGLRGGMKLPHENGQKSELPNFVFFLNVVSMLLFLFFWNVWLFRLDFRVLKTSQIRLMVV